MPNHERLILASKSKARAALLRNAGLSFKVVPANIDEEKIARTIKNGKKLARHLAREKALSVAKNNVGAWVIGADQVLTCGNRIFSKAKNKEQAKKNLKFLSGKTHHLHSALCIAHNEKIVWQHLDSAALTMREMNNEFLQAYITSAGKSLTDCVGAYALEGSGAWLFEKIEGDYFTILGLPLLPLLSFLQERGGKP